MQGQTRVHCGRLGWAPSTYLSSCWHLLLNARACQWLHDICHTPDAVVEYARILQSAQRHMHSILFSHGDAPMKTPAQSCALHCCSGISCIPGVWRLDAGCGGRLAPDSPWFRSRQKVLALCLQGLLLCLLRRWRRQFQPCKWPMVLHGVHSIAHGAWDGEAKPSSHPPDDAQAWSSSTACKFMAHFGIA
jgi:hypothetical protein